MKFEIRAILFSMMLACGGCATQHRSRTVAARPDSTPKGPIVAVLPFKNNTADRRLDPVGVQISDAVSIRLLSNPKISLVERQRLNDVLAELRLQLSGIEDPATAVKIGKMLGANHLVFGSYSIMGGQAFVTIRVVRVETGEIIGGASETTSHLAEASEIAPQLAAKVAKLLFQ